MSSDESSLAAHGSAPSASRNVILSPYVNEPFPAWEELLSAHDVARLTRRPRWVLAGLAFFGQFPRKRRYHGRGIGWLRHEVLNWMHKGTRVAICQAAPVLRQRVRTAITPSFESDSRCAARRRRGNCSLGTSRPR